MKQVWFALVLVAGCGSDKGKQLPDAPSAPDASMDLDGDGYTVAQGDCNDADPAIHPGADEICDPNEVDEDCDGGANDADPEGPVDGVVAIEDADGDGYGAVSRHWCVKPFRTATMLGDCDETDRFVFPGAFERCDGKKDDCNSTTWTSDDGLVTFLSVPENPVAVDLAGTYTPPTSGTIMICPGTYTATIVGTDVNLSILSPGMDRAAAATTFLDGGGAGPVLQLTFGTFDVQGLTLQHGSGVSLSGAGGATYGGAIYAGAAHLRVLHSVIADNAADNGAGIYLHSDAGGSFLMMDDTKVVRNAAANGGGILVASPSTADGNAEFGDGVDENPGGDIATQAGGIDYDGLTTFHCTGTSCN